MRIAPLPPLQCLVAFESAVRHASFTKAAAELHLTQSAISRQIAQLEDFLGRSLFVREHRALRLTIAGEGYAKQVQWLLASCSEATLDVMKHYGDQELTIACSSGVAVLWLTPRLGAFRAAHPNVKIRMIVRDGLASLSPAEFDVGLYYIRQRAEPHFTARRLFDEEVYPVCSPGYLAGRVLDPAALAHETLLVQEDGQRQWMSWSEWFGFNGVQLPAVPRAVVVNHYPQLVQMAILGQGVVLGWRNMIDACLNEGLLVRATHASASHGGGYYVVSPNDRSQNQAARTFTRWLFEQAEEQRGGVPT
ncbi:MULTISPECIES: LysR substrate-binding domain-containing protein [Paraburkholderia]|uniref:DNA-binding transcriptional LysR family regulator n=2 Tax=Paraburkholderia TaxID=1822464 RepID=A0A7Z0B2M2_9BURK|nr:LysR substrate-binding domain-containing protein [Paraburkholderia bryophila]NYH19191.1 DNA-binding transcriptional LysR family regulator [Paraburkholderia bryophila]